jgi:hypothetical protein
MTDRDLLQEDGGVAAEGGQRLDVFGDVDHAEFPRLIVAPF